MSVVRGDNCCSSCMNVVLKTKWRRLFLPCLIFFIIIPFEPFREIINYTYFPIVSGFNGFVIFWNFPFLAYITASKPLYYEDLFIDEKKLPNYDVDERIKNKFKLVLEIVLIITNSLLTGALADYYLYKTTGDEDVFEIIGVTGGIIKIFQIINNSISRFMLKILKKCIKKESIDLKKRQIKGIERILRLKRRQSDIWKELAIANQENRIIVRERADTF